MAGITVTDLAGRVLAGRYRLLAPVGTGASGRVYLADDVRLKRRVAVKVLHGALADDAAFLRRFRAEAQVAAALHHPHIVTVHDWGEDGVPFMVLEMLSGGSLRAMLDRGSHLSPAQAAWIGRDVASALEYAHARGIVHRDVKPANLLFDEHGIVRVADFGLARALAEASWTEPAGGLLGTARYASPEQAMGTQLDARSDLYSLSIVLVEAVTGRVPFASDTPLGTLSARTQRPILAPEELGPLRAVVERAGRIDPDERYPDAATMRAALAGVVDAGPRPAPLVLPGADDTVDPHPTRTQIEPTAALFDQDRAEEPAVDALVVRAEPKRVRRLVPFVVAAAVVLALVGAAFGLTRLGAGSTPVQVPGVVGMRERDAAETAREAGVRLVVVQRRAAQDPSGVVLEQDPAAGSWFSAGDSLQVVVSAGPEPVEVPDLRNETLEDAAASLEALGLIPTSTDAFDSKVPEGRVISQDVAPGTTIPPDSKVDLVVSKGPAPVAIVDVRGKTYDEAAAALSGIGLSPTRRDEFDNDFDEGEVVGTEPAIGTEVRPGAEVVVIVSKGPDLVEVPRVVGLTLDDAVSILEDAGLVADVQGRYRTGDRVSRQSPSQGSMIPRGSDVTIRF
jgi:serine/threonine-protein kinase